jgi:hypothetical protein
MDKSELETLLSKIDIWLLVFGVIVVIGVAGESFFGIRHWWNSRKLQSLQQLENDTQRAEIVRLSKETADANVRASEANQKAEEEKLARIKLEERLAWRRISPKEYPAFVAALKPFKRSVVEVTKLGEVEAGQFADDVVKMFADSEWGVQLRTIGTFSPPQYGLQCEVNEGMPGGKALAAILKMLPTASVRSTPELPTVARILVGLRPPP